MRTDRPDSLRLVSRTGARIGGKLAADAPDRRAIYPHALLWLAAHDGLSAGRLGPVGQSQAGAALDANHGFTGYFPEIADDRARGRAADLSLLAPRGDD